MTTVAGTGEVVEKANLETDKFVKFLSSQGEIDALTITHPPSVPTGQPNAPRRDFSTGTSTSVPSSKTVVVPKKKSTIG